MPKLFDWEYDSHSKLIAVTVDDDGDGLYEFEAVRQSEWIPVTERLPEDYHDVLVSLGDIVDVGFHHHRYGWECYSCKKRNDVTHWMPLPEPPKEV